MRAATCRNRTESRHGPTRTGGPARTDAYRWPEGERFTVNGRRVWIPVDGDPRLGTVTSYTYAPKTGAPLYRVELDDPVDGTDEVVVNPEVDDVLYENDL